MADRNVQETLDRILADLKSDDKTRQLAAIHKLGAINHSSEAILRELEQLALGEEDTVQKMALAALSLETNRNIASQRSEQTKSFRYSILNEIDRWQADDLIEWSRAEVLRRHYDFDIEINDSAQAIAKAAQPPKAVRPGIAEQDSDQSTDQVVQEPIASAGPRPSLMQTLLSEASIRVYLYLGAFFVIASALILAAIVEAARLPILVVATLAFGAGSLIIRKRLPQPSAALFVVFSFLLLIDANVLEEMIGFAGSSLSIYWTIILLMMAFIWVWSTWFYDSRFFSLAAFISLSLAFYRAGEILQTETELNIFLVMLSALVGLGGVYLLKKWRDDKFASPLFWLLQVQTLLILMASIIFSTIHAFESGFPAGGWILILLTWMAAAAFYTLSDFLLPFILLRWIAVGTLVPIPWFFLNTFDATLSTYVFGFWLWGMLFALASEIAFMLSTEQVKKFHWPFLAGSAPLFLLSFFLALFAYREKPFLAFAIFGLTAIVYAVLHVVRQRWYVWLAALLSVLAAYFIFFYEPLIEGLDLALVYQLLIASLFLVVPELFARSPLSLKSATRLPLVVLGILVSSLALLEALTDSNNNGRSALVLLIYAVLFVLHALHSRQTWLGYFGTAAVTASLVFALDNSNIDRWLFAITILSVLYYAAGFLLRRIEVQKAWGPVLINSSLILGAMLSIVSIMLSWQSSGWFIIIVAILFAIELLTRPLARLEMAVEILFSISLFLILNDFKITNIVHFLFGASIIWMGGDWIFNRTLKVRRPDAPLIFLIGCGLVLISTVFLWRELNPILPLVYFTLYAVFFAIYAVLEHQPRLGYFATAFLPQAVIKLSDVIDFEKWIFPLIALAVLYYAVGFLFRRNQKATGWDSTLVFSGLGLGLLTSFASPVQGGLDASIPIAIAATLFAAEAFALRNVWWALPANLLYLMSYFMILLELNVDEPQYYSIGAALLGMLMNYLLTKAGSKTGAFIAGMLSQLVLLGTTYVQMVSNERLSIFFVMFAQSLVILAYGIIMRSRSLVIAPIGFAVLGVMTVLYSALKNLSVVVIIGITGITLLGLGILAVLMRERITTLAERFSDWNA